MDKKKIAAGIIAAAVVSTASAANTTISEKEQKTQVMRTLLNGVTTVMSHPECTVKNSSTNQ